MNVTLIRALREAVKEAGGLSCVAKQIGVKPPTVAQWVSEDPRQHRPVPVDKCAELERVIGARVTRRQLRPNDWHLIWPELVANTARQDQKDNT